jgi:hypothetical protein
MKFLPILLSGVFILASCGTARTMISEPVIIPERIETKSVAIVRGKDTVAVSDSVKTTFEKQLCRKLFFDGLVQRGSDITLEYRFIQYNEGNRFARYMLGGIGNTGEASLMMEVTYLDSNHQVLGKIMTEGRITSGLFGGSSDNAVEKAADEVASYTRSIILCG